MNTDRTLEHVPLEAFERLLIKPEVIDEDSALEEGPVVMDAAENCLTREEIKKLRLQAQFLASHTVPTRFPRESRPDRELVKTPFRRPTEQEQKEERLFEDLQRLALIKKKFPPSKLADFLSEMGVDVSLDDKGEPDFSKLLQEDSARSAQDNYKRALEMVDMSQRIINFPLGLKDPKYQEVFGRMFEIFKFFESIGGLPYSSSVARDSGSLLSRMSQLSGKNHSLLMNSLEALKANLGANTMADKKYYLTLADILENLIEKQPEDLKNAVKEEVENSLYSW